MVEGYAIEEPWASGICWTRISVDLGKAHCPAEFPLIQSCVEASACRDLCVSSVERPTECAFWGLG